MGWADDSRQALKHLKDLVVPGQPFEFLEDFVDS